VQDGVFLGGCGVSPVGDAKFAVRAIHRGTVTAENGRDERRGRDLALERLEVARREADVHARGERGQFVYGLLFDQRPNDCPRTCPDCQQTSPKLDRCDASAIPPTSADAKLGEA
jgi:hypothetical protein